MFSAGETSGDLHGANLAREILQMDSTVELIGFGGSQMQQAGVRLYKNFSDYNIMGVWEVIKNLRRILKLLDELEDFARREKPNLLVLIDYPDFNWRLAKRIKKLGIPIFSYIPPSAWAWRKGRAKDCAEIADEFVAMFPFELPVYQDAGANISFVGNPLVDSVQTSMSQDESRKFFGVQDEPIILLMPGSRRQEIHIEIESQNRACHRTSIRSIFNCRRRNRNIRHSRFGSRTPRFALCDSLQNGNSEFFYRETLRACKIFQPAEYFAR